VICARCWSSPITIVTRGLLTLHGHNACADKRRARAEEVPTHAPGQSPAAHAIYRLEAAVPPSSRSLLLARDCASDGLPPPFRRDVRTCPGRA
jgi:hypothetical protein